MQWPILGLPCPFTFEGCLSGWSSYVWCYCILESLGPLEALDIVSSITTVSLPLIIARFKIWLLLRPLSWSSAAKPQCAQAWTFIHPSWSLFDFLSLESIHFGNYYSSDLSQHHSPPPFSLFLLEFPRCQLSTPLSVSHIISLTQYL